VGQPAGFDGIFSGVGDMLLADYFVEIIGAVFAGKD
jgi:hypothetical protein